MKKYILPLMMLLSGCAFIEKNFPEILPTPRPSVTPTPNPSPGPTPNPSPGPVGRACAEACEGDCLPIPTPTPTPQMLSRLTFTSGEFCEGLCTGTCAPFPAPTPIPASTDGNVGFDWLGGKIPIWNQTASIDILNRATTRVPVGTIFDNTFGFSNANITGWLATGKINKLRLHLFNGTCISNNVCFRNDGLNGYSWGRVVGEVGNPNSVLSQLICKRAQEAVALVAPYPATKLYLSGILEHMMPPSAGAQVVETLRRCAPSAIAVDNPRGTNNYPRIAGVLREGHGTTVNDINSPDGSETADIDVDLYKKSNAAAVMTLKWGRCMNGRSNDPTFVQADRRTVFCDADLLNFYDELRKDADPRPGSSPSACARTAEIKDPLLWKTLAEDKGPQNPDVRKNKPLFISKSTSNYDVLSASGAKIGCLKFYGGFGASNSGLFRAYAGSCSNDSAFTLSTKARASANSSWIFLKDASGTCYPVNATRRAGYFRP